LFWIFLCCCFGVITKGATTKNRQFIYDLSMLCLGLDHFRVAFPRFTFFWNHISRSKIFPYHISPFHIRPFHISPFQISSYLIFLYNISSFHFFPFQISPYVIRENGQRENSLPGNVLTKKSDTGKCDTGKWDTGKCEPEKGNTGKCKSEGHVFLEKRDSGKCIFVEMCFRDFFEMTILGWIFFYFGHNLKFDILFWLVIVEIVSFHDFFNRVWQNCRLLWFL
jgi:hypothetical protein